MEIIEVSSSSVVPGDRDSPQHSQWLQKTLSVVEATSREQLALGTWQVENLEISDSYPQFVVEDPEIKCDSANFDVEYLMEENLQQQTELARRNIEKKLVIDKLRLQLEHVKAENRSLQNCISCLKVGEKRKSLQIRGLLSGKFFGGGCT